MRKQKTSSMVSRRQFLTSAGVAGAAIAAGFPAIIPARVLGAEAPSKLINVGVIGCGRIGRSMEIPGILKEHAAARIVAVSDLDSLRMKAAQEYIEAAYAKSLGKDKAVAVKPYGDYRAMLQDAGIDAVMIATPDHWHALPAVDAALAGKDIWLQKPCSMTIAEGRVVSDIVRAKKRMLQIGSQQRSWEQFRIACELVRNGRIGKITNIEIGLPLDPAGGRTEEMPVPSNLNYDMWLGPTPAVAYTEDRVHPQGKDGKPEVRARPGWLRMRAYTCGMITGWGAHHFDIAHWGMGTEFTGPVWAEGSTAFLSGGLWNVHGAYKLSLGYANGVLMKVSDAFPNGVKFIGEKGWIFVTRGNMSVTASDPTAGKKSTSPLQASDPDILKSVIGENEIHLHKSDNHFADWLQSIHTRKEPVAPVEVGHRSCSACLVGYASMELGRKVTWNPDTERFGDDEANKLLTRPERKEYSVARAATAAGFAETVRKAGWQL